MRTEVVRRLFAVSMWATTAFAQLPQLTEMPDAETQTKTSKQRNDIVTPKIWIRVYDLAHIEPTVLAGARSAATEIFKRAGVETGWLDCPVTHSDCDEETERPLFMLRILSPSMVKEMGVPEALGFAMPCDENAGSCVFYIFYCRISALAEEHRVGADRILGHVMSHEIGHALLGENAHELFGIMQSRLSLDDMERTLFFTSFQSKRLRAELLMRSRTGRAKSMHR
jgi:hypothetical protein